MTQEVARIIITISVEELSQVEPSARVEPEMTIPEWSEKFRDNAHDYGRKHNLPTRVTNALSRWARWWLDDSGDVVVLGFINREFKQPRQPYPDLDKVLRGVVAETIYVREIGKKGKKAIEESLLAN